jgi:hypothetical protein
LPKTATIRQAAQDGRIELASTVLVDTLELYVELVLNALDHPEVWLLISVRSATLVWIPTNASLKVPG